MNTPLQIGITGGIGSGKSLVCKIFQRLGVPVYDADSHAKALMTTDGILVSQIKKEFGDLAYHPDGSINRSWLASHVFSDEARLGKLNNLVHPRVALDYENWVKRHVDEPYLIKEAALLFESGSFRLLDKIIVVSAPEEVRQKRVLKRDAHRTVEQFREIVEKQLPEGEKLKRADYIIVNDDTTMVIPQVLKLHDAFKETIS
ncbi:MAG TPA: dephospho-CoA kinase [Chryseosolibacter sp.]|nr:dephospho-CoA kinase [Chryseosolibacter sp.]